MAFGGIFQSINSPSVGHSLLSGLSTTAVLISLVLLWKRVTRGEEYQLADLLPNQKQFRWLLIPAGLMYLIMGILLRPDWYPSLIGHFMIWIMYGIVIFLFIRSQKQAPSPKNNITLTSWEPKRWLILAGIFPLAATLGEVLTSGLFEILALVFWFGGILFGLYTFIKAVQITFPKEVEETHG
jgi:hypothetical protein